MMTKLPVRIRQQLLLPMKMVVAVLIVLFLSPSKESSLVSAFGTLAALPKSSILHREGISSDRIRGKKTRKRRDSRKNDYHFLSTKSSLLHLSLSPDYSMTMTTMTDMIDSYGYYLKCHYYPTQSMTNAIITMVGDGIAQKQQQQQQQRKEEEILLQQQQFEYNYQRGLVYFFKGLLSGVMWSWWFEQADDVSHELAARSILSSSSSTSTSSVLSTIQVATQLQIQQIETILTTVINILLEQFMICPILFAFWDIPVTSVMLRGVNAKQVPDEIKTKLGPLLVANAKVWTFANVITYNIPFQYRILFASVASIISETINAGITSTTTATTKSSSTSLTSKKQQPATSSSSPSQFSHLMMVEELQLQIELPSSSFSSSLSTTSSQTTTKPQRILLQNSTTTATTTTSLLTLIE